MIRNIIFDMGRVLIRWEPDLMLASRPLSDALRAQIRQELFQSVEWVRLDRGTMTEREVCGSVCARLPEEARETVEELVFHWHRDFLTPVPGMEKLISELKAEGYGIYLLSNAGTALRGYFGRIPGSQYFDGLMVSAEEHLLKPEHEIYERLYERFSLDPSECWFIDDHPPNLEAAQRTGMRGTIFRGNVSVLRRELRKSGLCCAAGEEAAV